LKKFFHLLAYLVAFAPILCRADSLADALRAGRYNEALSTAEQSLKTEPHNPRLLTVKGFALAGLGRKEESIASFHKALRYSPQFVPALEGAAEITYNSRDARATGFLEQLLAVEPRSDTAHLMIATLHFEASDCSAAVKHFCLAPPQLASNVKAATMYGSCLLKLHRPTEAVQILAHCLEMHPQSADLRYDLQTPSNSFNWR
jgi:Flp pilus assembly protein TadD